jgi:predicted small lipoprotein YifL
MCVCPAGPHDKAENRTGHGAMWRLFKALLFLAVLAAVSLTAYAYLGPWFSPDDFAAPQQVTTKPVTLDVK